MAMSTGDSPSNVVSRPDSIARLFIRDDGGLLGVTSRGRVLVWDTSSLFSSDQNRDSSEKFGSSEVLVDFGQELYASSYSKEKDMLALGFNGRVVLVPLSKLAETRVLTDLKGRFNALDFAPDGSSLLLCRTDNKVYRWKFLKGRGSTTWQEERKRFERYIGHAAVVSDVHFHPFGRLFLSTDWDGRVFVWETYDSDEYSGAYDRNPFWGRFYSDEGNRQVAARLSTIESMAVSPDGQQLVLGFSSGVVEFWIVRGLKLTHELSYHKSAVTDVVFYPDSKSGLALSRDGELSYWRFESGVVAPESSGSEGERLDLAKVGSFPGARAILPGPEGVFVGYKDNTVQFLPLEKLGGYRNDDRSGP